MNQSPEKLDVKISTANTRYKVLRYVAKELNWKLTKSEDNWNVMWFDCTIPPSFLSKMKGYQRVNHFPGMYAIARKSNLCMNLNKIRKRLPNDFNFYPRTWFLPSEFHDFSNYSTNKRGTYIVKPAASSQGKGIFMISEAEEVNCLGDAIVQEYIDQPLLIDGLKFDMRIYVLVSGCDPLRIFIHKEGLARFATEKYFKPAPWNLDKVCMHLTNYSLNKSNPKFIKNKSANDDNQGHKRSLSSTLTYLEQKGFDVKQMWKQVSDMVVKTIASIQPSLAHTYRTCRPADVTNAMCFEILGFDVILDKNFQPWLLEVNHSPSFETSTPLDKKIKTQVIVDCLKLLGLAPHDKKNFESRNKMMIAQRSIFRKSFYEKNQDLAIEKEIFEYEREVIEESVCGLVRVYPKRLEYYKKVIDCAKEIVEEFTGARKRPQTTGRTSTTPQPARGKSLEKSPYRRLAVDGKVVNKDCSLKKKVKTKKI